MDAIERPEPALPPQVAALRVDAAGQGPPRLHMERSLTQDMREERDDLKEAAEHSLNVILDLQLDGIIKWVSPSWQDVIGTPAEEIVGKPIADILIDGKDAFADAVENLQKDDSRSLIVRFPTHIGKLSVLSPKGSDAEPRAEEAEEEGKATEEESPKHTIELEAQGIVVYDRTSGEISHVSVPNQYQNRQP